MAGNRAKEVESGPAVADGAALFGHGSGRAYHGPSKDFFPSRTFTSKPPYNPIRSTGDDKNRNAGSDKGAPERDDNRRALTGLGLQTE